jgi:hypothetical protein
MPACPCQPCRAHLAWLNLAVPEMVGDYVPNAPRGGGGQQLPRGAEWCLAHPQQPLLPDRGLQQLLDGVLDWGAYNPEHGFVGFAANLLYLTPRQLAYRLTVRARQGA